jgi:hypothetical protein
MSLRRILLPCLLGAFLALAAPARADNGDAVHFGSSIHINADSPIHDAVCFFCSIHVEGKVTGDIVVFFGDVHLNGDAQHDVVSIFGNVNAADNSSIDDDLVSIFGSIRLGENVAIGKDMVALFGYLHAPASVRVGGDRVEQSGWIVGIPVLVLLLIVIVIVREYQSYRRRLIARGYQFPPKA